MDKKTYKMIREIINEEINKWDNKEKRKSIDPYAEPYVYDRIAQALTRLDRKIVIAFRESDNND